MSAVERLNKTPQEKIVVRICILWKTNKEYPGVNKEKLAKARRLH